MSLKLRIKGEITRVNIDLIQKLPFCFWNKNNNFWTKNKYFLHSPKQHDFNSFQKN